MSWMVAARERLRALFLGARADREMDEELRFHLEQETALLRASGLDPGEARRQAQLRFGGIERVKDEVREARGLRLVDAVRRDLRVALRHLARHPLSAATIVVVLALGIAVDVVLFTMVDSFTNRPPSAVEASETLVRIRGNQLRLGTRIERRFALAEVDAYLGLDTHFSEVAAWTSQPVTAGAGVEETTALATFVTDDYFPVLGVQPVVGSGLADAGAPIAVVSYAAWTRWFGDAPDILGQTLTLNGVPFSIAGVAPPRFRGAAWEARDDMQVWLSVSNRRRVFPEVSNKAEVFRAVGRLRPGVSLETAAAAVRVVADRSDTDTVRAAAPDAPLPERAPSADVVPLLADNLEPTFEENARTARLAFGVLGLLTLLVTSANVGGLQTGLALARTREIAIRMSLGAQRGEVVRQLLTESLLLATLASVVALGVVAGLIRLILTIFGTMSFDLVVDARTLVFTSGVALVAGLLFGLAPALHTTRVAIGGALQRGAGSISGGRARLQRALVVTQIALTQPLAVCLAWLVTLALFQYQQNPPTPDGQQIVRVRVGSVEAQEQAAASTAAGTSEQQETTRLVDALRQVPEITHAVFHPSRTRIVRDGFTLPEVAGTGAADAEPFYLVGEVVMPGYLDVVGVPIVLGRDLETTDSAAYTADAIPVIVGDDMAQRLWGEDNPIGQRVEQLAAAGAPVTLEVIGVYAREPDALGHARQPFTVFVPPDPRQLSTGTSRLVLLRTSSPGEAMMPTIREVVENEIPGATITELSTLASLESEERFILWGAVGLISTGGIIVLLLSALGLYAVVAFAVGQRTDEIAVRIAIGSGPGRIIRRFAADGLRLTTLGMVLGVPLGIAGIYGLLSLQPNAPAVGPAVVTATVAAGILGVAAVASWLPASRAARVDPAAILRRE